MEHKLNLMLVGKAGDGKSSTGNSLLTKQCFKTSSDATSITSEILHSFTHFENDYLVVVDGLRIESTMKITVNNMLALTMQMDTALDKCSSGIDAFLYIMKFCNRFNADDMCAFEGLKRIFGHSYLDRVIVVLTYGENFEREKEEKQCDICFRDWCRRQKGEFSKLYKDVQERVLLLNNIEKDDTKKHTQIQAIVQRALDLQKTTRNPYTRVSFNNSKNARMQIILEEKAPQMPPEVKERLRLLAADGKRFKNGAITKFILIGETGVGKSATGNSLLNRSVFETSESQGTQEVDYNFTHSGNDILMIVDTPGLGNISSTEAQDIETAAKHMETARALCCGKIDAILFVIKFGTTIKSKYKTILDNLKQKYGENFLDHVIVIVTYGDTFNNEIGKGWRGITFPEWCQKQTEEFSQLYDDCQQRFVLVNNKEENQKKKETQIQEIAKLAHGLRYTSTGIPSPRQTSRMFDNSTVLWLGGFIVICLIISLCIVKKK